MYILSKHLLSAASPGRFQFHKVQLFQKVNHRFHKFKRRCMLITNNDENNQYMSTSPFALLPTIFKLLLLSGFNIRIGNLEGADQPIHVNQISSSARSSHCHPDLLWSTNFFRSHWSSITALNQRCFSHLTSARSKVLTWHDLRSTSTTHGHNLKHLGDNVGTTWKHLWGNFGTTTR